MDLFKKHWDLVVLAVASVLFFISANLLIIGVPTVFNSPDENANHTFAIQVLEHNRLSIDEPINLELRNILHPRSVIGVSGKLVPGSFLGLPVLYGFLGKIFGAGSIRFFTPLFAIAAVFAWRAVVEALFKSKELALIAALAVMFHPGFWYYAGRGMMHNVGFVSLLMISAWMVVRQRDTNKPAKNGLNYSQGIYSRRLELLLAGIILGLALWFRTFEIIWILPIVFVLTIIFQKKLGKRNSFLFFWLGVILTLAPMLMVNQNLYGGPFATGYTVRSEAASELAILETSTMSGEPSTDVLPFGFNIKSILRNSWNYSVRLFPWLSLAAFFGFLVVLGQRASEKRKGLGAYMIVTVLVTVVLWIIYGSWNFTDNPDPKLITIGTSYVRYWLPIFVLISPFFARFIVWIGDYLKQKVSRGVVVWGLVIVTSLLSIKPVFFAEDGLLLIRSNLFLSNQKQGQVLELTEPDSIIVVDRADKFLWPDRRVVQPLRSELTYAMMPELEAHAPLYYFGITFPQRDLRYLNQEKLPPLNLQIELVETIQDESLYRIYAP